MTPPRTIAIVGAGPGLGFSIAKRFGAAGFQVALLARNAEKLDGLVAELGDLGVTARSYVADITDRPALADALARAEADFGSIDVLEFSPVPSRTPVGVLDLKPEDVVDTFEAQILGAIAATNAVLPGMRSRRDGALLFTTGASSLHPFPPLANAGIPSSGLRNYVLSLNQALAPEGIYAGHVALDLFIEPGAGEADPDSLANRYFELYERRDRPEVKVGDYVAQTLTSETN